MTIEMDMRDLSEPWGRTIDSFLYSCHELKPSTRKGYGKCLRRLPCATLADFTLMTVNRHIAAKLAGGHKTLAHHDGVAANQMGKWLVSIGIFPRNPMAGLRVPKQPLNRRQPFTNDDVDKILAAGRASSQPERDVTALLLAFACGLRKGEILSLQTADVHLEKSCGCLNAKKPHLIVREGKSAAATRRVPISAAVVSQLDTYIKDWRPSKGDGALFLNNHGDDFSDDGWSSVFRRVKARVPGVDFKLHRARNTALTAWSQAGVDIRTVGYLAGHSRIEHTERYLGAITPAQIDAVPDAFARRRSA